MRITIIILALTLVSKGQAQNDIEGKYVKHAYWKEIIFKSDSTFETNFYYDVIHKWAIGTWRMSNDTIYLVPLEVWDTITRNNKPDTLLLSGNKVAERIDQKEYVKPVLNEQLPEMVPDKLYYRDEHLYEFLDNGKLNKKKVKGYFTKKKFKPYYDKSIE